MPTVPGCVSQSALLDVAEAVAFGAGVVFVDHRAPPFDHLALDVDGQARPRGSRDFIDDTSYFRRTSSGSFSMRTNMVGTHWLAFALYFSM